MTTNIRGAGEISDTEFLRAYNDPALTNAQVIAQLNTNWDAVRVKLRSERLCKHLTVERTGAVKFQEHSELPESRLTAEARAWKRDGTITGSDAAPAPAAAPVAVSPSTGQAGPSDAVGLAQPAEGTFSFVAEIYGERFRFSGEPSTGDAKGAALNALMAKLRQVNFSKAQITDIATGRAMGINDLSHGGNYRISKQLTAAAGRAFRHSDRAPANLAEPIVGDGWSCVRI